MKHLKLSRLFAATLFVALLALTGCTPATEIEEKIKEKVLVVRPIEAGDKIVGTWVGMTYGDKYEVTVSNYNNYYNDGTKDVLYYTTNNLEICELDKTSGIVYAQFNDADKIGYNASVNQWYAFYYFDLTDTQVCISAAAGEKGGCDTLDEAIKTFTKKNGYFSKKAGKFSTCKKQ